MGEWTFPNHQAEMKQLFSPVVTLQALKTIFGADHFGRRRDCWGRSRDSNFYVLLYGAGGIMA